MKTAISIPDEIFRAAERVAKRLGLSRSELYARAVAGYVDEHDDDQVTEALDRLYGAIDSGLPEDVLDMQISSLPKEKW
jgi:metal-responsive CopG/Arc/MetJ family transcriptional regulator